MPTLIYWTMVLRKRLTRLGAVMRSLAELVRNGSKTR
jgi:hypothetical protein